MIRRIQGSIIVLEKHMNRIGRAWKRLPWKSMLARVWRIWIWPRKKWPPAVSKVNWKVLSRKHKWKILAQDMARNQGRRHNSSKIRSHQNMSLWAQDSRRNQGIGNTIVPPRGKCRKLSVRIPLRKYSWNGKKRRKIHMTSAERSPRHLETVFLTVSTNLNCLVEEDSA